MRGTEKKGGGFGGKPAVSLHAHPDRVRRDSDVFYYDSSSPSSSPRRLYCVFFFFLRFARSHSGHAGSRERRM